MACYLNHFETLFSFEIFVEYIRTDNEEIWTSSDELALGVRLLDFPTLLIYQRGQDNLQHNHLDDCEKNNTLSEPRCDQFKYAFNKGKSCLFKINLNSLHAHLSNTPLYAMVLDVKEELPKLIGTSLISLAKIITHIRCDVEARGVSNPSFQGERGLVNIFNLMGEKIGRISLSYKLVSLGASLLPHIPENKVFTVGHDYGVELSKPTHQLQLICRLEQLSNLDKDPSILYQNIHMHKGGTDERMPAVVSATTQTEHDKNKGQTHQVDDHNVQDDIGVFCPPRLFYISSVENKSASEGENLDLLKLDLCSPIVDDFCSGNETPDSETETPGPPIGQSGKTKVQTTSRQEEAQSVAPNAVREALRQLPLLNALLVELSQLTGQTEQQQPLSIHPHLAWIYRPVTDSLVGRANSPPYQTTLMHKSKLSSPMSKVAKTSKNCSTPHERLLANKQGKSSKMDKACLVDKIPHQPTRKKLAYGTTKSFCLRMKQVTPGVANCSECLKPTVAHIKEKVPNSNYVRKATMPSVELKNIITFEENIKTTSSVAKNSEPKETTVLKPSNDHANKPLSRFEKETPQSKQGDDIISKRKSSHLRENKLSTQIRSVDTSDASPTRDSDNQSERNPSETESDSESHGQGKVSLGSRGYNRPKPTYSTSSSYMSSREYIDDFTSIDPSDGYSPAPLDLHSSNPLSSPETVFVKNRSYPVSGDLSNSDSTSGKSQKRRVNHIPIKAHSYPQRSLRSTQIIQPHNQASAPYLSSDNENGDGSASICTVWSRNQPTSVRTTPNNKSVTESIRLSRSQLTDSTEDSGRLKEYSVDTISSFEPHEVEELNDELSSLGFKSNYQHISELVTNKLPGYTL